MPLKPPAPSGARSSVYKKIIDLMQSDKYLSVWFPKHAWTVSRGEKFDPENMGATPHIYVVPRPYSASWFSPDTMISTLQVDMYIWLPGNGEGLYNACDVLDIWEVIERVFYPAAGRESQNAIKSLLKEAGATTGIVQFSQPATQQQTAGTGLVSFGSIQIDVKRLLSP